MEFNTDNEVVRLCVKGMEFEGQGQLPEARKFFNAAWNAAQTDFERFTAAHYVARLQISVTEKLSWDETALRHALNIQDKAIREILPSLYLNIGKCYEDLSDINNAKSNYEAAFSFASYLPHNGYGNMIKSGIAKGLHRTK